MIRQIVPWRATGPGDVTLITSRRLMTKTIKLDAVEDYDHAYQFAVVAVRLDCLEDLAELLEHLLGDPHTCIIRGVLRPEFAGRTCVLRRYRDRPDAPAPFAPADRQWLMTDADGIPTPPGVDPTDPLVAGGALRRALPPPFRTARAVAQLSSTAGLEPGVIKGHLWHWLDRPISDAEAKRWLGGAPVDGSIYQPVGIHYVASPIFDGVDDPCIDGRLAILPGYAEVAVPALPDPVRPAGPMAAAHPYMPPARGLRFRSTRSEQYMLACLHAVADAPIGKRHPTFLRVAARLFGLAKAGALNPEDVASRIKGAVKLSTFDRDPAEVDDALRWAWEHSEPWRLP